MDERKDASIDIEKLADYLRGKFDTLVPLSNKCCIYRVPERIRLLDEGLFTPRAVSIGPFHHGREEFKAMEEHKIRYLRDFLQRTGVSINDFLIFIKDREAELRQCYAESIKLGSDEFVKMILVDAAFVIEILLRSSFPMEPKFAAPSLSMRIDIWPDMWMLENQLPMFILDGLFELANSGMSTYIYQGVSMFKLTSKFLKSLYENLLIEESVLEIHFSEAKHFVDLLRLSLTPELGERKMFKTLFTPTITELHQAGVKFELGSSKHLFDIRFKKGILEIPKLKIVYETEALFRNLQAFEQLHCDTTSFNDYIIIINHLIKTGEDVELLIQSGVIENWLCDSEGLAILFRELVKETTIPDRKFYYSDLVDHLNAYSRIPRHRWKAILKQNYFNTPWASISVIAAVILLILTFIQAVCSIIAL